VTEIVIEQPSAGGCADAGPSLAARSSHLRPWSAAACPLRKRQVRRPMLTFGVMVLAVTDRRRPEEFWCAALRYDVHTDGFGGWPGVLMRRSERAP